MEKFFEELYSYEYFNVYLMISIIVLLIIFLIILFFGKKDQKTREIALTKKLQEINSDAFKEESTESPVEIADNEEKLENDTIVVPKIEDIPVMNSTVEETHDNDIPEPVLPMDNNIEINEINNFDNLNIEKVSNEEVKPVVDEVEPLLDKIEEKPLVFENTVTIPEVHEENVVAPLENEKEKIEVPEFNLDEIVKGVEETKKEQVYNKGPQIFSSVYVPEKEEIELPKAEEHIEPKEIRPVSKMDDLDIELPTLKKEEKEEKLEKPVLNDYNLDNLSGESYTINK